MLFLELPVLQSFVGSFFIYSLNISVNVATTISLEIRHYLFVGKYSYLIGIVHFSQDLTELCLIYKCSAS